MFISLGLPGAPLPAWWAPVAGGLLGAGAHPLNVLPDIDDDLAGGVRGLPHRLGAAGSRRLAALLLLAATAVLAFGPGKVGVLAVAAAIAGAVLVGLAFSERPRPLLVPADGGTVRAARAGSSRRAFRLVLVLAALDVALLIARGRALA
jgi:uncharacterized membrane protein